MPNIGSLLKDEIARLSRREARRQNAALKKAATAHRKHIAALRQQIVRLEKQVKALAARAGRSAAAAPAASEEAGKLRFQARGLKTLRARLGLSAADLGKLLGVTGQSVYNWEAKKATPRREQIAAIAALRGVGKREVAARLSGITPPAGDPPRRGRKGAKAAKAAKPARAKRGTRRAAAKAEAAA